MGNLYGFQTNAPFNDLRDALWFPYVTCDSIWAQNITQCCCTNDPEKQQYVTRQSQQYTPQQAESDNIDDLEIVDYQ